MTYHSLQTPEETKHLTRPVDNATPPRTRLAPCPDTPNCVSSISSDVEHGMSAIPFEGNWYDAKQNLLEIVRDLPRTTIVKDEQTYLHVEFRSLIFRFVDDVEFVMDPDSGRIDFRSASRLGRSDYGANRRRMERIRSRFLGR